MDEQYVSSRRERKKRDRKYAILRAARELMKERGTEVRVEEIAALAGISYPTFFNYYPTKAALYYAIYTEEIEDIREFIDLELADEASAAVRLRRVFEELMKDFSRYGCLDLYLAGEVARFIRENGGEEPISDLLESIIEDGVRSGEFAEGLDSRCHAVLLVGALFSASFYGGNARDYAGMLDIVAADMPKK